MVHPTVHTDAATIGGNTTTAAIASAHARRARVQNTIIARAPSNATAAAVCPEGKLDVGGTESSCDTGGRGRSTTKLDVMKTVTSRPNAPARDAGSVQRRKRTTKKTVNAAVNTIFTMASASPLPTHVTEFQGLRPVAAHPAGDVVVQLPHGRPADR